LKLEFVARLFPTWLCPQVRLMRGKRANTAP